MHSPSKLVNIDPDGNTKMVLMLTGILQMTGNGLLGKYYRGHASTQLRTQSARQSHWPHRSDLRHVG